METKFKVSGIMCQNCVRKVTEALTALGASGVKVSDDFKTVTVTQEGLTRASMMRAIEAIDNGKFIVEA